MSLIQLQQDLEQSMVDEYRHRQKRESEKLAKRNALAETTLGSYYVRNISGKLIPAINEFLASKPNGKHLKAAKELFKTGIQPETLAFLTTKAVINMVAVYYDRTAKENNTIKRNTLCMFIANMIHDEWRIRHFGNTDTRKALLKKLFKDFDRRNYPREWRKRTIQNYFDAEQVSWEGWHNKQKVVIGYALLKLFADTTGLLDFYNGNVQVGPSQVFLDHASELLTRQASQFILYKPMVVPPYDWSLTNLFRGGYISKEIRRYPLIKRTKKRDVGTLVDADLTSVLAAVNALQRTKWRINKEVHGALQWSYSVYGGGVGKLPLSNAIPLPPLPEGYHTDEGVKRRHNHDVFLIHDKNRQAKSPRIAHMMLMGIAEKYKDLEFYFPHDLDSRGRAYPVPVILNPQGPDHVKALLEFADGEPVENQGQLNWIMIAGANAYGNDKVSLSERVQWVTDNEEMILSCAENYAHDRRWHMAGDPFQFLRFCFEWAQFKREGYGYISHMVCPVDATCSGLQHYAAMLRDEVGGRSVNLIPGLARQDVYGDVASLVIRKLVESGSVQARAWLDFGIDRKITKRQVMVVPYAGKFSSCMEYTRQAVDEKCATGVQPAWDRSNTIEDRDRIVFLAQLIWEAIDETVVKGKAAMSWIGKVASLYSKWANRKTVDDSYARRMTWVTPDGFPVSHYKAEMNRSRIATFLDGRVDLVVWEEGVKLDRSGMALAVAPNFVHSLDATQLRMTINKATACGINSFAMIHDSFGTHARHMPAFVEHCVKPSFVEMYTQHDPIGEFYNTYKALPECPVPPEKGSLDITGVQRSEFFFS
jgi:DNA-directed RNA polymerase